MAKREVIQVDEDKLKRMIAGDLPKPPVTTTPVIEDLEQETIPPITVKEKKEPETPDSERREIIPTSGRKRKNRFDYSKSFLEPQANNDRRQTTVQLSGKNYLDIIKILQVSNRLSIGNFINNVLTYHFEEFDDEILEIKRNFLNKLYRNE